MIILFTFTFSRLFNNPHVSVGFFVSMKLDISAKSANVQSKEEGKGDTGMWVIALGLGWFSSIVVFLYVLVRVSLLVQLGLISLYTVGTASVIEAALGFSSNHDEKTLLWKLLVPLVFGLATPIWGAAEMCGWVGYSIRYGLRRVK